MKLVQCEMSSLCSVMVNRPGLPGLEVDVFTPVQVPETEEEQAQIPGGRFIPLRVAQRLVDTGRGSWIWVTSDGRRWPGAGPSLLAGMIPSDFPYAEELRRAGFHTLDAIPNTTSGIAAIPKLIAGKRPTKEQRSKAAKKILDALDALIRKEE